MKITLLTFAAAVICLAAAAQTLPKQTVYTQDIDNFWAAYDKVVSVTDTLKQQELMKAIYIDKATDGLKAFMKARNFNEKNMVKVVNKYPRFWKSVRQNTLNIKTKVPEFKRSIERLKVYYPNLRPASIYFTIGCLRAGGTTTDSMVLIGTEIASADKNTDASELTPFYQKFFKDQNFADIVSINVHEYVHTQQQQSVERYFGTKDSLDPKSVLAQCIVEGAAEFISEMVTEKKNIRPYMIYGEQHEDELKAKFKTAMHGTDSSDWLYNGSKSANSDLGYFIGYQICKAYYQQMQNKKQAVTNIIELNYIDDKLVDQFLEKSKYLN